MHCFKYLPILSLSIAVQAGAQGVGGIGGWYGVSDCAAAQTTGETGNANAADSLAQRARELAQDLPPGIERDIAEELVQELEPGGLQQFCREASGELVARYTADIGPTAVVVENESVEVRVRPQNLSVPEIAFDVTKLPNDGGFRYAYRIANKAGAPRSITSWGIVATLGDSGVRIAHPTWRTPPATVRPGSVGVVSETGTGGDAAAATDVEFSAVRGDLKLWTATSSEHQVRAGTSLALFTATSSFLPGWTTAYFASDGGVQRPARTVPDAVEEELDILLEPYNNYSPVFAVGPKFEPGIDRSWIAGDWHIGVQMMISNGLLSADSAYVTELLRSLDRIATAELRIELSITNKPAKGMETLLDKIVRMAL